MQIVGEDLAPFLHVRIGSREVPVLIESPTRGEIKRPELAVGTYDLALYDEAQELFQLPGALRVIALPPRDGADAIVRVRFAVGEELLGLMKVGDVDVSGSGAATGTKRAVLTNIGSERQAMTAETTTDVLQRTFRFQQPVMAFSNSL